jgi:hypothetical protein
MPCVTTIYTSDVFFSIVHHIGRNTKRSQ